MIGKSFLRASLLTLLIAQSPAATLELIPWPLRIADGATIGHRAVPYTLGPITIEAWATVSQGAHLCAGTHDYTKLDFLLLKQPITVGEGVWICAETFIGPNVMLGDILSLGRAVVMRNVPPGMILAGPPPKPTGRTRS